jgi:hypothetical protein
MAVGLLQPTSPRPALTFDVPAPLRHVRAARFPTDEVEQLVELLATGASRPARCPWLCPTTTLPSR